MFQQASDQSALQKEKEKQNLINAMLALPGFAVVHINKAEFAGIYFDELSQILDEMSDDKLKNVQEVLSSEEGKEVATAIENIIIKLESHYHLNKTESSENNLKLPIQRAKDVAKRILQDPGFSSGSTEEDNVVGQHVETLKKYLLKTDDASQENSVRAKLAALINPLLKRLEILEKTKGQVKAVHPEPAVIKIDGGRSEPEAKDETEKSELVQKGAGDAAVASDPINPATEKVNESAEQPELAEAFEQVIQDEKLARALQEEEDERLARKLQEEENLLAREEQEKLIKSDQLVAAEDQAIQLQEFYARPCNVEKYQVEAKELLEARLDDSPETLIKEIQQQLNQIVKTSYKGLFFAPVDRQTTDEKRKEKELNKEYLDALELQTDETEEELAPRKASLAGPG